jgi:hypothetical protein
MDELIVYISQIIAFLILLIVVFADIKFISTTDTKVQLIISIIIMTIFIIIDPLAGFLLACSIFIIYFKNFKISHRDSSNKMLDSHKKNDKYNTYISEANLLSAQSNIFDNDNMNHEVVGFNDGFVKTDKKVYGAQGMYSIMPGFVKDIPYNFI